MQAFKSVVVVLCAVLAVSASGCAADKSTDTPDDDLLVTDVQTADVGGIPQSGSVANGGISNVDSSGRCCWGHCNSSGAFVFPFLTEGCRAAVVNECHRRELAFLPNGDAWWGDC
jgi:hypothetical protein